MVHGDKRVETRDTDVGMSMSKVPESTMSDIKWACVIKDTYVDGEASDYIRMT